LVCQNPIISGSTPVCKLTTNTYTTESGKTNYDWTVSFGGTIVSGGDGFDFVTVRWTSAGSRSVKVIYSYENCTSLTITTFPVVVGNTMPGLSGPGSSFLNTTGTYTTDTGQTNYDWTVSSGGTITVGGDGFNSVTVLWNATGSQSIQVTYTSSYGCTVGTTTFPVTVSP